MKKLNDDVWREIFSYLDLKSIFTLEHADMNFREILKRTRYWERKIEKEFPYFGLDMDLRELDENDHYIYARRMYWNLHYLSHDCNICKLCVIEEICKNIPDCEKCDWLSFLDQI